MERSVHIGFCTKGALDAHPNVRRCDAVRRVVSRLQRRVPRLRKRRRRRELGQSHRPLLFERIRRMHRWRRRWGLRKPLCGRGKPRGDRDVPEGRRRLCARWRWKALQEPLCRRRAVFVLLRSRRVDHDGHQEMWNRHSHSAAVEGSPRKGQGDVHVPCLPRPSAEARVVPRMGRRTAGSVHLGRSDRCRRKPVLTRSADVFFVVPEAPDLELHGIEGLGPRTLTAAGVQHR